jgi:hypothetical protein
VKTILSFMNTSINARKVSKIPVVFDEAEIFAAAVSSESDAAWNSLIPG